MEMIRSKYLGFCRGVSRAVATLEGHLAKGEAICTYGPIINNKKVVEGFKRRGIHVIDNLADADGATVVLRSHGVPPAVYAALEAGNIPYLDCTCPDVKKIHGIVKQAEADNRRVIIAGSASHPEIVGIMGYCEREPVVVLSAEEAKALALSPEERYAAVAQTTFIKEKYEEICRALNEKGIDLAVHDTICCAMAERQREAEEISQKADVMVVIGDKGSSNTTKLAKICLNYCENTHIIETISDLQLNIFHSDVKIGVVAGASTSPEIIKEAITAMSELENTGASQTFEQMLDESFITLHTGDVVKGTVISIAGGEVSVNLGYKSDGLIPRNEFSEDPDVDPADFLKPGDEMEVFVVRVNDGDGNVLLSKKKIDAKRGYDEVEAAFNDKTPILGKVVEVVKGGLVANVRGVRVFVPSSQAAARYVEDLSVFKGKEFRFEIIEFDKVKRRIVGSRKALAIAEQEELKNQVFDTLEVGQDVEGTVSRIVTFGAFVDLGGVDGLIHISQLSWGRVKKVTDAVNIGDKVKAHVLEVDKEKGRISLSLKNVEDDPWNFVLTNYQIGDIIDGKVVRMASFGAFVEIAEGIDGLVHISQIASRHVVKPEDELSIGQMIKVKIMDINKENNRVSLSKREADIELGTVEEGEAQDAELGAAEEGAAQDEAPAVAEEAAECAAEPCEACEEAAEGCSAGAAEVCEEAAEAPEQEAAEACEESAGPCADCEPSEACDDCDKA